MTTTAVALFEECARAIASRVLITRESRRDKEFHFQDWVRARIEALGIVPQQGRRNSFPDFVLPSPPEGYEVKGLEFPGRYLNYDANSQPPMGAHGGWSPIFYVFGRYPKDADTVYPVTDLVIVHGDFLNATHDYVHRNRHVKGFGSYGDIMIRDRKMYVVPTPYALANGVAGHLTLILPSDIEVGSNLVAVGTLPRREAARIVVGYDFDLRTNEIQAHYVPNPHAGREHSFVAYRLPDVGDDTPVTLEDPRVVMEDQEHEATTVEDDE